MSQFIWEESFLLIDTITHLLCNHTLNPNYFDLYSASDQLLWAIVRLLTARELVREVRQWSWFWGHLPAIEVNWDWVADSDLQETCYVILVAVILLIATCSNFSLEMTFSSSPSSFIRFLLYFLICESWLLLPKISWACLYKQMIPDPSLSSTTCLVLFAHTFQTDWPLQLVCPQTQ